VKRATERPSEDELRDIECVSAKRAGKGAACRRRHVPVLPEDVVDVRILPPDAPADDIVPTDMGADELPELGLPLPLQPRQPDALAGRVLRHLPLVQREHLPAAADEGFELRVIRYQRDGVAHHRHVPPMRQVPRRRDKDRVLPENPRLRLGEVCWPDKAAAPADTFARHRRRWRWCDGEKSGDDSKSEWWAAGRSEAPGGRR
jgi:hypothetical protein